MRRVAVVAGTILLLAALGAAPASAQTDAASVARALINAENAHDVNTVVNLFAPGAIVNLPTGTFVGRAEIAGWQRDLAAGNFHAEITPPVAVTPEVVTFSGTVALDLFRGVGIPSLASTWELTIQLGQVTTFNFNFTPEAGARLAAALGGGGGAASPTGAAPGRAAASAPATPAAATAGRSLALTGADLRVAGAGVAAVVLGALLLLADRRRRT